MSRRVAMDQPPVRLCCMQRHYGAECPDGKAMCCLCFSRFEKDDLYKDDQEQIWDVCKDCHAGETK